MAKQHGAAEARRAHNPEVPRSKRGVAIFFSCGSLGSTGTAMTQRTGTTTNYPKAS
jgi:hypothetical protein